MVDGEVLVRDFALTQLDARSIAADARAAAAELARRAGLRDRTSTALVHVLASGSSRIIV